MTQDSPTSTEKRPSSGARRKARHYAMQGLYQWHMTQMSPTTIEAQFRTDYDMKKVDVVYFSELLQQIPRIKGELEVLFEGYLDRSIEQLDPIELSLLRMGSYELKHRIDVPYRVVINESVSLAKKFGASDSHKFINGILDKVASVCRADEKRAPS